MITLKNNIYQDVINHLCLFALKEDSAKVMINESIRQIEKTLESSKCYVLNLDRFNEKIEFEQQSFIFGLSIFERNSNYTALTIFFDSEVNFGNEEVNFLTNILKLISLAVNRKKKANMLNTDYRSLLNQASDSIFVSNAQGNIVDFNFSAANMLGYTKEEMSKLNVTQLLSPKSLLMLSKTYSELMSGENIFKETELIRKNGEIIYVESTAKLLNNGYIQSIVRDITQRKNIENKLLESEERFRSLSTASFEGIVISIDGYIIDANYACSEISGYPVEELIGMSIYNLVTEEDKTKVKEKVSGGSELPYETRILRKDGSCLAVEFRGKNINYHGKNARVAAVRDISSYKEAEEQIRKALKEKELLLKEIHHRVKNNLQIISSLLSLQSGYIKDKKILEIFKESQNRIKSMAFIHEKLYESKNLDKIDFAEYIKSLINNLFHSYGVKNEIFLDINTENIMLSINHAIPCGLIIGELVANSLKYAFDQVEGDIDDDSTVNKSKKISINFKAKDKEFILEISDNGKGLPPGIKLEESETLGLQLVKLLVDQLEGFINIENKNGLKFVINFKNPAL